MTIFMEKGHQTTKIIIIFFVKNDVLSTAFKKNSKLMLWNLKFNVNCHFWWLNFWRNFLFLKLHEFFSTLQFFEAIILTCAHLRVRLSSACLSSLLKESHTVWIKSEKQVLGAHCPHICGFVGPIFSKNNWVHPWVNPSQPCKFYENQLKTATCIMSSYTYSVICEKVPVPVGRKRWPDGRWLT